MATTTAGETVASYELQAAGRIGDGRSDLSKNILNNMK
jgi:hypothetical protein